MELTIIDYLLIAESILFLYPAWRISKRTGVNPAISFTVLIPGIGIFIYAAILSISSWSLFNSGETG